MQFKHDCENCKYLGNYQDHDIYRSCDKSMSDDSVVLRYGSDGPEYETYHPLVNYNATDQELFDEAKAYLDTKRELMGL